VDSQGGYARLPRAAVNALRMPLQVVAVADELAVTAEKGAQFNGAPARPGLLPSATDSCLEPRICSRKFVLFVQVERRRGVGRTHEDICARRGTGPAPHARRAHEIPRSGRPAAPRSSGSAPTSRSCIQALQLSICARVSTADSSGRASLRSRKVRLTAADGVSSSTWFDGVVAAKVQDRTAQRHWRAPPGAAVAAGGGRTDCGGS